MTGIPVSRVASPHLARSVVSSAAAGQEAAVWEGSMLAVGFEIAPAGAVLRGIAGGEGGGAHDAALLFCGRPTKMHG
jgi:hypothetical protein